MNNADKPINPATSSLIGDTEFFEYNLPNKETQYSGLTKREYFAGLFLQGILSAQTEMRSNGFSLNTKEIKYICGESVLLADSLLKQLETTQD